LAKYTKRPLLFQTQNHAWKSKGLANNGYVANKAGAYARNDDFAVPATPLYSKRESIPLANYPSIIVNSIFSVNG
jgi:hypothetical protein